MKEPSYNDKEKCIDIRKRSRQGQFISKEDSDFCEQMFKNYKAWYKKNTRSNI